MNFSDLSEFLVDEAKFYRNGLLSKEVVPMFDGEMFDENIVKAIINPYLVSIRFMLHEKIQKKLDSYLNEFSLLALDYMYSNPDMHEGDQTCRINQANADALLVTFLSFSCGLSDLCTDDLLIKEIN